MYQTQEISFLSIQCKDSHYGNTAAPAVSCFLSPPPSCSASPQGIEATAELYDMVSVIECRQVGLCSFPFTFSPSSDAAFNTALLCLSESKKSTSPFIKVSSKPNRMPDETGGEVHRRLAKVCGFVCFY